VIEIDYKIEIDFSFAVKTQGGEEREPRIQSMRPVKRRRVDD
jgi:hypothetical protein